MRKLLAGSPHNLRPQTVFCIMKSRPRCRIQVETAPRRAETPYQYDLLPVFDGHSNYRSSDNRIASGRTCVPARIGTGVYLLTRDTRFHTYSCAARSLPTSLITRDGGF